MRAGFTRTAVVVGVRAHIVDVQAHVAQGLPHWSIVGLPDTTVSESRDRVRAAVASSALPWPTGRITVGLGPASLPKRGSGLDVGIAVAVLCTAADVPDAGRLGDWVMVGELGLDGRVRPVGSVLPAALAARREGARCLVVPAENAAEASLVAGLEVLPVVSLRHLWAILVDDTERALHEVDNYPVEPPRPGAPPCDPPDLADVRGQDEAREALVVAAAGGHHLCLAGPAGVGKTLLASRLPSILPELDDDDALEVTAIKALSDPTAVPGLVRTPPFCAPHHSASETSLIGGGAAERPRIGLVTRAHAGVLFLDEAAEFSSAALDALRQSLESRTVTVSRSGFHVELPARFQLVLATNPCPCGRALDASGRPCTCSSIQRRRYWARLEGPLLDRVDVRVQLRRPTAAELSGLSGSRESSASAAARVIEARERAATRLADTPWQVNAAVPAAVVRRRWPVPTALQHALDAASMSRESLRGLDLCLRLSWTLADLKGADAPDADDLARAMALRNSEWAA